MKTSDIHLSAVTLKEKAMNLLALAKGIKMDMDELPASQRANSLMLTVQAHLAQVEDALTLLALEVKP